MSSDNWDSQDNRRPKVILSENNKDNLMLTVGIIIIVSIITVGTWFLCDGKNKHREKLYSMGYSQTPVYKTNGNYSCTTWMLGNGSPVVINDNVSITQREKIAMTHDRAVEFLRNELKGEKND